MMTPRSPRPIFRFSHSLEERRYPHRKIESFYQKRRTPLKSCHAKSIVFDKLYEGLRDGRERSLAVKDLIKISLQLEAADGNLF